MRSPGRKSKADSAWLKATVAFSTIAMFLAAAPTSRPSSSYVSPTLGSASSSASYPPIAASRSRCAVTACSTGWGMSAAPALFKWIRSRHPGVSRRQRSSSAGAEGREGEVRVVMSGKVAGWPTGLKSSRSRLKPRLGGTVEAAARRQFTDTCRVAGSPADWSRTADRDALGRSPRIVLVAANRSARGSAPWFAAEAAARRVPLKRQCAVSSLTRAESRVHPRTFGDHLPEQVSHHKPHILRSLGEPAHVPREPVCPIADQDPHRHALVLERALLGGADAVEHVHFVRSRRGPDRQGPLAQPCDEADVVRAEYRARLALGGTLEQLPRQHGISGVDVALFRKRHARSLVVGALHEPDRGGERKQCFQVCGRTAQVGLEADTDARVGGAHGLEQLERCVHIA